MASSRGGGVSGKALWYLTRGSGAVSLVLLTLAVVLGILTSTRWARERWPRFVVEGLHRNIALLAPVFVGIHIASAVIDGYVPIRWIDAVMPFGAAYKPFWLGLGALAFDVFVAVAVTSLVRVRLGYRAWRAVHWLAYACWVLAVAHGIGSGSDRAQLWMLSLDLVAVVTVLGAVAWRVGRSDKTRSDKALSDNRSLEPRPT
ncbi:MAG TPA: ferric reductase-like transmembrane domain-containing protein [Acidimicrobiales bacterium]|nr:ferric reductase-like transmembrane domain-containing protein [Acidimicrobiales bacterium]